MATINEKMTAIADAIREKTGGTELLGLDAMAEAIAALETGGGLPADLVAVQAGTFEATKNYYTGSVTIQHGLGVQPDFFIFVRSNARNQNVCLLWDFVIRKGFYTSTDASAFSGRRTAQYFTANGLASIISNLGKNDVTKIMNSDELVVDTGSVGYILSGNTYMWICGAFANYIAQ